VYIYLDVIWLLNFLFDGLLLLLTAIILKRKVVKWRLLVGAIIGSSIVLLMVSPISSVASHPMIKLLFSIVIILATFGYKRFRYFIQGLLTFYFTTFMIGGGMVGVYYFLEYELDMTNNILVTTTTGFGSPISWLFVIIGFPVVWYFSKKQIDEVEMKKIHYEQIVQAKIRIDDVTIELRGLIDTGNQLYDPISKSPVMVVEIEKVKEYFPKSIIDQAKNMTELTFEADSQQHKWENRIRIIPYRGVGQEHQFLLAIKPDFISIFHNNEIIKVKKVLVALNHTKLSSDDQYDCIIHPKMIVTSTIQPAS